MSSFFSSTNNYSLYALPAAWLLSIAPHFYAVTSFNNLQKKLKTGAEWDNSNPRGFLASLQKKDKLTADEKRIVRSESAQQNGFENVPFFGIAILAGNYAKLAPSTLNTLALVYLASRVVFNLLYINTTTNGGAKYRSVAFLVGIGACFTLIIKAGNVLF